jgi:DNA-directed RNA polymerase subunit RPC12/RpoP
MTDKPKPHTEFRCAHCRAIFGQRSGDVMIAANFRTPYKRGQPFECGKCGKITVFGVRRDDGDNRRMELKK